MIRISILVAMAADRVIGREGRLPWRCAPDLARFKALTMGHDLLMGRRTFESIGRPLPGRRSIVLTRHPGSIPAGVEVAASFEEGLALARGEEVFVIGGAEVYARALPIADRLYLTRIEAEVAGDVRFPEFDPRSWRLVSDEGHPGGTGCEFPYRFQVYDRAGRPRG